MRFRRLLVASASAVAMLGLGVAAAVPAHASTITDNGDGSVTVSLSFGETVAFCATSVPAASCDGSTDLYGSSTGGTFVAGTTVFQNNPSVLVPLPAGTYNMSTYAGSVTATATSVVIGAGPVPSSSSSRSSGPAPVMQQFGKPASGTCDEAQPEGLDWAGVPSGGWTTTWGEWMNDNTGGWVCSRTLSYSTAMAKWVVY